MRILLTGSSGWLGRFIAPMLRAAGHQVTGLDPAPGADTDVVGSVADRGLVGRVFADAGIEAVIHSGGLHKPDIVRYPTQAFVDVNVTGTLNLLEAAVEHGVQRFVFTSTTSLMISAAVRAGASDRAIWLDEGFAPLEPRNIYGITKLAAEQLCRLYHQRHALRCVVLRTGRFFPEEDDTDQMLSGENKKANEFLNRRLTVEDAAAAHLAALDRAPTLGYGLFLIAAPTPFAPADVVPLKVNAAAVVARYFPDVQALYAARGWELPTTIDRVYDSRRAEKLLGFRCQTDFATVLQALRDGAPLPYAHDAGYVSPLVRPPLG
ncbi:MAG: NAD(P)-dependent oxidoreductase [Sphingomonas sp.]|nr:NAD(P)-dependent oxidoreductase [Sphingomonas sp.]